MPSSTRLSGLEKAVLALRIWGTYLRVRFSVQRMPLPRLVARLAEAGPGRMRKQPAARLSRAVSRALTFRRCRPTCLVSSLVLFRLLTSQGEAAELVVGLPFDATNHEAHAWVEIAGVDVGPPPGRGGHTAMARFGRVHRLST